MAKIAFSGSFVNSLPIGRGCGRDSMGNVCKSEISCIFVNYKMGVDTICVIIPSESWIDIIVTVNSITVDLTGEYPNDINIIIRKAVKLFPNFRR